MYHIVKRMLSLSCILGISANHFESFALGAILSKVVNSDKKEKKRNGRIMWLLPFPALHTSPPCPPIRINHKPSIAFKKKLSNRIPRRKLKKTSVPRKIP
jgi:hypothetical protein